MKERRSINLLPVSDGTLESSVRVMKDLVAGGYQEHFMTNAARPFGEKQHEYLTGYVRNLRSLNHRYVMECRGDME